MPTTSRALPANLYPVLDSRIMRLGRFFQLFLPVLCAALLCQLCVAAQESKPQPASPPATSGSLKDSLESNPAPTDPEIVSLQGLATQLLHHAGKAGCRKGGCTIMVMNFVLPDGHTSRYCMYLADELSSEMAKQ